MLAALLLVTLAPMASAHPDRPLTVQEQARATALAGKVLELIRGMSPTAPVTAFEGAILGDTSGAPCEVVKAALTSLAAEPGLPANALAALKQVGSTCGAVTGAIGGANYSNAPGFGSAGGGANYR